MAFPQEIRDLMTTVGKAGVHAMFPNDFEYYAVSLELTDSKGDTVEYLTFPVSPESMSYDNQSLVNIRKTMSGISVLDNETMQVKGIELTGTFGRKFKILSNTDIVRSGTEGTSEGFFKTLGNGGGMKVKDTTFNPKLKTGYGTTKVLEAIIEKSKTLDEFNRPHKLFLYNPTLGHNWLVKVNSIKLMQDRTSSNMLWKYNMQLTAIAPMESARSNEGSSVSLQDSTVLSVLQGGVNTLTSKLISTIL